MLTLSPAAPQRHEWLTLYPLLTVEDRAFPFDLLADAIRAKTLRITEVGTGTVPELLAVNSSDRCVLILDGEQFIGARQNRMASRTILLLPRSETQIPVSCMEHGRWHFNSPHFASSLHHSPSLVRRHNRQQEAAAVARGVAAGHSMLSQSQGDVWNEIASHAEGLGSHSGTGALDEVTASRESDLEMWTRCFPVVTGQVGILAFVGTDPLGLDVIGDRRLYSRLHERLVGGYIQDALRRREAKGGPDPEAAETWLGQVWDAMRTEAPTVGGGRYRVISGAVTGGELDEDGDIVHLSAFPIEEV